MTYQTHNDIRINTNMSSGRGSIDTDYFTLVGLFGRPEHISNDPADKVRVEWSVKFDDGTVATIYDWKDPTPIHEVRDWHVGGFSPMALTHIASVVTLKENV